MSVVSSIRVPCSTSNLGPGFDCLGLALSLWLDVRLLGPATGEHSILVARTGEASSWPSAGDRLLQAFDAARALVGAPPQRFEARSEIPVGRGFGSSGSATAAGLLFAASLAADGTNASKLMTQLHRIGVEQEGHPDNVTASLFGGLTVCHPSAAGGEPLVACEPLSNELAFVLAWSEQTLPTARARSVLPTEVAFEAAVDNPRRLALLLAGLRDADEGLLRAGAVDHLHEAHRIPLIHGARETLDAARESGAWAASVSGAGSGLVAITTPDRAGTVAEAMRETLARHVDRAHTRVVEAVTERPRVRAQDGA